MKIKVVLDSSGPGSVPRGTVLEVGRDVSEEESRNYLASGFAVPVVEERVETPTPKQERVETREDKEPEPVEVVTTEPEPEQPEPDSDTEDEPVKRGPGRPPGSKNKPKPQ